MDPGFGPQQLIARCPGFFVRHSALHCHAFPRRLGILGEVFQVYLDSLDSQTARVKIEGRLIEGVAPVAITQSVFQEPCQRRLRSLKALP